MLLKHNVINIMYFVDFITVFQVRCAGRKLNKPEIAKIKNHYSARGIAVTDIGLLMFDIFISPAYV